MVLKLVSPIKTRTVDNFRAEISKVDPKSPDCFVGTIDLPSKGKVSASWDKLGICRNRPDKYGLDLDGPELMNAIKIANELGR